MRLVVEMRWQSGVWVANTVKESELDRWRKRGERRGMEEVEVN